MVKLFTREELKQYNGIDKPAYVAYKDKVYDVSGSYHWQKGKHQVTHLAGSDLTEALKEAPHGSELLDKFPVVGVLVD